MDPERHETEPAHEFRLEGIGLLLGGGLLLAAIVGSFLVGRWYERRTHPPPPPDPSGLGALEQLADPLPEASADQGLTFFDDVEGGGQALEPAREAAQPAEPAAEPPAAEESSAAASEPFWVQVFAGRDRTAAEQLVASLTGEGLGVRMLTEREGGGALFKVQVGGYRTEAEARTAAGELEKAGYSVWVPPPE